MKTLNVVICDDDREILGAISGAAVAALAQRGFPAEVTTFSGAAQLLEYMRQMPSVQLILLDIDMPQMDGIAAGKKIREFAPEVPIIYVSECESRVFDAFQAAPLCFVRKSHFLKDLSVAVDLYQRSFRQMEQDYVEFIARSGMISVESRDITYIEGQRNYQQLHLYKNPQVEELKMTMDRLEELLKDKDFIRIHKGFLVNHRYIQRIDGMELQLRDGTVLPIGRSRIEEVKRKYIQMM